MSPDFNPGDRLSQKLKTATAFRYCAIALGGLMLAVFWGCQHKAASERSYPVWQPNQALSSQLGPEVSLQNYGIRPPQGYQPAQADALKSLQLFGVDMHIWHNSGGNGSNHTSLSVIFVKTLFNAASPEDVLQRCMNSNRSDLEDFVESKSESGRINGVTFVRTYWSGVERFRSTGRTALVQGCSYASTGFSQGVYIEGRNSVDCSGGSCRPQPLEMTPLPLTETSVFTFHKL